MFRPISVQNELWFLIILIAKYHIGLLDVQTFMF